MSDAVTAAPLKGADVAARFGMEGWILHSSARYGTLLVLVVVVLLLVSSASREFGRPTGGTRAAITASIGLLLTAFLAVVVTRFVVLA
jgi:hypothetical protein